MFLYWNIDFCGSMFYDMELYLCSCFERFDITWACVNFIVYWTATFALWWTCWVIKALLAASKSVRATFRSTESIFSYKLECLICKPAFANAFRSNISTLNQFWFWQVSLLGTRSFTFCFGYWDWLIVRYSVRNCECPAYTTLSLIFHGFEAAFVFLS